MRVVSGRLGGRVFEAPRGHRTHPMSEKARGALFSVLGDVSGLTALDAYAGSGALGIEAASRGAARVVAIDSDKQAAQTASENVKLLGLTERVKVVRATVSGWSDNNPDKQFDLVFCDPPYDNLQASTIQKMTRHVADEGLMVLSWPGGQPAPELSGLDMIKQKPLGDITLTFYKKS